ncbi:undecaprenyl-diphosphatase [Cytobacillus sp. IB215316]|uniref:undecaprenyl-diphosphatase n=1 Tax=Cytobacillus sp. IB215316 TaxID=3097354 RepID=UPI0039B78EF3
MTYKSFNRHPSLLDIPMIFISNNVRFVFIFILGVLWFRDHFGKKIVINSVLSVVITLITNTLIKFFVYKPRPFIYNRVGILLPSKRDSSFPSKHTLLVFTVSTSILLYERALGCLMLGLSVLTGISRVWVGHHYLSDVIGSAFIGSLTSMIVDKTSGIYKRFMYKNCY